jgi:two-component system sensor histidine kinase KdpD
MSPQAARAPNATIERARLAEDAERAQMRAETERLRNSLLSSVSHDLRTPLASITGAAGTLLENEAHLDAGTRRDLLESLHEEADRLNRLVQNLVEMTRLESGALQLHTEWHPVEEVVGAALGRFGKALARRTVTTRVPPDLPLVPMDDVLIEVADRGPGLPAGEERRIFEKFHRAEAAATQRGAGLGLAICQGIVSAHGGRIWAENRPGGGVRVRFTLPIKEAPPVLRESDG